MPDNEKAVHSEDLTRLFVERANCGEAEEVAELYEEHAVMDYSLGQLTNGRDSIDDLWEKVLSSAALSEQESPLQTLISGDIVLTSSSPGFGERARAQVVRRRSDGTWRRLHDRPHFVARELKTTEA